MHFRVFALALSLVACSSSPSPDATEVAPVDSSPPASDAPPTATTPAPAPITPACDVAVPRTKPLEVFVQPDCGQTPYTDVIGRAKRTIRVMVYEMGFGPILDGLQAKAKAGVDVRIILDVAQKATNQKYMDTLVAAGAK